MSDEQLSALLAKLKADAGLKEKFQGAADLETFVAMAKEAGLTVNQTDWLTYQAKQTPELNDAELETIAGGYNQPGYTEGQECATKYCGF